MASLRDLESELVSALRTLEPRTPYAEAMAERTEGSRLRLDRQTQASMPQPRLAGVVFRAWTGDSWRESAASGLTPSSVRSAAEALRDRLPAHVSTPPPGPSAEGRAERVIAERRPLEELTSDRQIEWARGCYGWATEVEGIKNAFVALSFGRDERLFVSTAGAYRYKRTSRALGTVTALAMESGKVDFDYVQRGATGGAEVLDLVTEADVTHAAREAKALLAAKEPPVGPMTVLLDPSTAGTFAHESFGHGTEADQILRHRSYLAPLLGQTVGPDCLTIVDDGGYEGGWGSIYFDDEGQRAGRTVLIDRGRFAEVLHDRESAAELGRKPTGNARRADFLSRPFVRMTNTYVAPGDQSFDELIREAKDGVLLENFTSGIEDPLGGNMQLKVKKGRRIEHGELTDILPSMALSGKVLDFLKSIRGVSRAEDFALSAGYCGKGQTDILPTAAGGPYVLARAIVGPA